MAQKRSIFEEVGERPGSEPTPKGGLIEAGGPAARRANRGAIRLWLMLIFAMVVAMIAVGGLTRLTDSGLSITQWKPITGALPPMTQADWAAAFARYQATPQYEIVNKGMSLSQFKFIYWWEWSHRQLGRSIGLVWALGFLFFWLTRRIPPGWTRRILFARGPRRAAGGDRLVDGVIGTDRTDDLGRELPAGDPSRHRLRHPRLHRLVHPAARPLRGAS